jgi:predicted GNAT superfamily acetyltransferase
VTWDLASPRVLRRLAGEEPDAPPESAPVLVRVVADGSPQELDSVRALDAAQTAQVLLEVPADIGACFRERPETALRWRELTRRAFRAAFDAGLAVEDFRRPAQGGRPVGTYVLGPAEGEGERP